LAIFEKEAAEWKKAIRLDMIDDYCILRALAKIFEKMGKYEKAVECQTSLLKTKDFLWGFAFWYVHLHNFDFEYRLKRLNAEVIRRPENAALYFLRGMAHKDAGRFEEAVSDYTKAIELQPDMLAAYLYRALANSAFFNYYSIHDSINDNGRNELSSEDSRHIDLVISDLIHVLNIDNTFVPIHVELGILYNFTGKYETALQCFNKALAIDPAYYSVFTERAKTFDALKEYQAAIDDLTYDIEHYSSYSSFEHRADIYHKIGQIEKAVDDYSKLIEKEREDGYSFTLPRCLEKRGKCYQDLREDIKAKADFDEAADLLRRLAEED
jgi:tetratricopeptide (TPR) repeat protein